MDDVKLTRDSLVLEQFRAFLTNNELRHDLTKGTALSKQIPVDAIARMFDISEAVIAEAQKRDIPIV